MSVQLNPNTNFCESLPRPVPNLDRRSLTLSVNVNNVMHRATVLNGTLSLKERAQTFETYKSQFESACSTKERVKRAAFAVFVTAVVVAIVAVAVFGGLPAEGALMVGFLGGSLFAGGAGAYLLELIRDGDGYWTSGDGVVGAIALPFLLVYYLAKHVPNRAKRMEDAKTEALEIADYVIAKKGEINGWLETRQKDLLEQSGQTIRLNQNPTAADLKKVGAGINGIAASLGFIENSIKNLDESHEAALKLREAYPAK